MRKKYLTRNRFLFLFTIFLLVLTFIIGAFLLIYFSNNYKPEAYNENNLQKEATAMASVQIGFSVVNVPPVINSISTFVHYINQNINVPFTVFTICGNTTTGTYIHMNLKYTDSNSMWDVKENGNVSFRIQALYENGSINPNGLDTGYFITRYETGSNLDGVYYANYPVYGENLTTSPENFSISAMVKDISATVYSLTNMNAIIKLYNVSCETTTPISSPAAGGGGGGGGSTIYVPSKGGDSISSPISSPISYPSMPSQIRSPTMPSGGFEITKDAPRFQGNIPSPSERMLSPTGEIFAPKNRVLTPAEVETLKKEFKEIIAPIIPRESISSIENEVNNNIAEMSDKFNMNIKHEAKQELGLSLLKQLSEHVTNDMSGVKKQEKIDEIIDKVHDNARESAGIAKAPTFISNTIQKLANVPKYEETKEKKVTLEKEEKIKFSIVGIRHTAEVTEINGDEAIITIRSDPLSLKIKIGETKDVDLNNDTAMDIMVTLLGVEGSKAMIKIESITEKMVIETKSAPYKFVESISKVNDSGWIVLNIIIIIIISIIIHKILVINMVRSKRMLIKRYKFKEKDYQRLKKLEKNYLKKVRLSKDKLEYKKY